MIKCLACTTDNRDTARFCSKCSMRLPGTVLQGRNRISGLLGQGGMGAVYLVEDLSLFGTHWALKELSNVLLAPADRTSAVQQFQKEAQILLGLGHPNLPRISHYFEENGRQHLVMEFIDGETLETRCQVSPTFLAEAQVVDWALQICDVLEYLHGQNPPIIFRDLKPANIMLTKNGKIKLIDFGIARNFQPGKTQDTQIMGTPGYAAPEQYGGSGQTDLRSDVYALGATLHTLLTRRVPGTPPFVFPPCRTINSGVSALMESVVSKATEYDRNKRYQSVNEMKQILQNLVGIPSFPAAPSASFVAAQPIKFTNTGPYPSFLAYCGHDKRITTWIMEFDGESCTCVDCDRTLEIEELTHTMQIFCYTCSIQTTWTANGSKIMCIGCGTVIYEESYGSVVVEAVIEASCSGCNSKTMWLIISDGYSKLRVCLSCGRTK